jgi:UDPglucose--hexose-1-phosphate uridylyltransferase
MPELRRDPITGRWVIISTEREKRPSSYGKYSVELKGGFCPFCEGNEQHTPSELLAYRNGSEKDQPGWTLRVVPNKYPALHIEGELDRQPEGMFDKMNGIGAHEVVVETPLHDMNLSKMKTEDVSNVFWAFRDRVLDLKRDGRFKSILIFKNHGEAAGATLEHSHSQIIALPIVPKYSAEEINGAKNYFNYKDRCVYCDIMMQEKSEGSRLIEENSDFIALSPFAPRFPFETWIMPRRHSAFFENSQKKDLDQLAKLFKTVLRKMNRVLDDPAYNMIIHSSPFYENAQDYYHWHLELIPKLTKVAGFEWGTGFYINPTCPEEGARYLREAVPGPEKEPNE